MKIKILATGKMKSKPLLTLMDMYHKRMNWTVDVREVDEITPKVMAQLKDQDYVIALDERGEALTSEKFSKHIEKIQMSSQNLVFLIGGASGYAPAVKERAQALVSFGKATWPHMMVRVMLMEQIYRAQQILAGHPYHKD